MNRVATIGTTTIGGVGLSSGRRTAAALAQDTTKVTTAVPCAARMVTQTLVGKLHVEKRLLVAMGRFFSMVNSLPTVARAVTKVQRFDAFPTLGLRQ
jgi:dienelactone hydrolase